MNARILSTWVSFGLEQLGILGRHAALPYRHDDGEVVSEGGETDPDAFGDFGGGTAFPAVGVFVEPEVGAL